jgi:hypothetical protein
MEHKTYLTNYEGHFEELAEELGDLRYDALAAFLSLLAEKLEKDSESDRRRGRLKLAEHLIHSSMSLRTSAAQIRQAWHLCEPYMPSETE